MKTKNMKSSKLYLLSAAALIACLSLGMSAVAFAEDPEPGEGEPEPEAPVAPEYPCMIGEVGYATLDEAVAAAQSGDTITLYADCTLTKIVKKDLTFTGEGSISIKDYTYNNGFGNTWVFDGVDFTWDGSNGGWLMFAMNGTLKATNGATVTFSFDSSKGANTALYLSKGAQLIVEKGSTFQILGTNTKGKTGQGIQLDSTACATINVSGGSIFRIDGTNRGYVNSPTITVTDSVFTVENCTSNASNGGTFIATNANISYLNNNGHGLSVTKLTATNSIITSSGNAYTGIVSTGAVELAGTVVDIYGIKGVSYWNAGIRLQSANASLTADADCSLDISDNYVTGIFMDANTTMTIAQGATLKMTGNEAAQQYCSTDKDLAKCGGAIVVRSGASATLPSDAVIYNNHASVAGDDIYLESGASIALGPVGSGWTLVDCNHEITGWFQDGAMTGGTRWTAHQASVPQPTDLDDTLADMGLYVVEINPGTISGEQALKAAHGVTVVSYEFVSFDADKTLPQEVLDLLPTDPTVYEVGAEVAAIDPSTMVVKVGKETWLFEAYEADSMITSADPDDNIFVGVWMMDYDETPKSPDTGDATPFGVLALTMIAAGVLALIGRKHLC